MGGLELWGACCCVGKNFNEVLIRIIVPLQGSIQQLVLKSDPAAVDDQCEEDDPYVSGGKTLMNSAALQQETCASLCWRNQELQA